MSFPMAYDPETESQELGEVPNAVAEALASLKAETEILEASGQKREADPMSPSEVPKKPKSPVIEKVSASYEAEMCEHLEGIQ